MNEPIMCDKCSNTFVIQLQEKKHGKGITETYFTCPHCNEHYTSYATDADIRRKQREIKKMYETLPNITDRKQYSKTLEKIHNKKSNLDPKMIELKNKI
ncbi:hypothetical protein [Virgibacillus pantothenticus]|uniref:Transglycosylase n=1 Tax=Virgibacillus pantothenticus TaxID=1473 RepID=A0A0L0QM13_VIRPA|nr:hypothetical protein [Virgibacillus pantothenticus]KNE19660.1 hypothetical protein AFK71_14475 [Virgibacillus pantothenticus]MED3736636.1 hypothetical protein [Virgibacillus pantothenticus]QTY14811.1 hypothetical protein KBP50_12810 [Virgibacillus pantothenticus]SIS79463.1 hypothetical protein SAMN05421787_103269 [Virgibacillus pantothenticus]